MHELESSEVRDELIQLRREQLWREDAPIRKIGRKRMLAGVLGAGSLVSAGMFGFAICEEAVSTYIPIYSALTMAVTVSGMMTCRGISQNIYRAKRRLRKEGTLRQKRHLGKVRKPIGMGWVSLALGTSILVGAAAYIVPHMQKSAAPPQAMPAMGAP